MSLFRMALACALALQEPARLIEGKLRILPHAVARAEWKAWWAAEQKK